MKMDIKNLAFDILTIGTNLDQDWALEESEKRLESFIAEREKAAEATAEEQEHIRCLRVFEQQVDAATGPTGEWLISPKKLFSDVALHLLHIITPDRRSALAEVVRQAVSEEDEHWLKALEAWPSSASDTHTMVVAKFADRVRASRTDGEWTATSAVQPTAGAPEVEKK